MDLGRNLGFAFSYFLFTTVLFFILDFLKRIPETWTYFHVAGITLAIVVVGILTERMIK